jgi:hypothetical protein
MVQTDRRTRRAERYVGNELELFRGAHNWKSYVRDRISQYLGDAVLEVGAGIGGTTSVLCRPDIKRWVCLEPDPQLAGQIDKLIRQRKLPAACEVVVGTLDDQRIQTQRFDTILYIDVLEHIQNDRLELQNAAKCLQAGGYIVVLAPAHQWLFSPFDEAIGHFRRYTRTTLEELTPNATRLVWSGYLDVVGLSASVGNRILLRRDMPTMRQIACWDQFMVRLSRWIDPLVRHSMGKSVLAIWKCDMPRLGARDANLKEDWEPK